MFEKSVEAFWFGSTPQLLAKRAASSTDPLEKVPHIHRRLFADDPPAILATAPVPDPLDVILQNNLLKMHGMAPQSDPTKASDYLAKMLETDSSLAKIGSLPGRVSLRANDDDLLEKSAHARQVSAAAQWLFRKLEEGVELEFLLANSSEPEAIRAAAEELLTLAKAA